METDATETLLTDIVDKTADEAIDHYGVIHQIKKAREEAQEFIDAIDEYFKFGITSNYNLIDETADIILTSYQVAKIIGIREVNSRLHFKAGRLLGRIHSQKNMEKEKE